MKNKTTHNTHLERALLPKEWDDALCALQGHERAGLGWIVTGKFDPRPLSQLLMSGQPVPKKVSEILGRLLNPPKGYIGGRLKYRKPGKKALNLYKKEINYENAYFALMKKRNEGELAKSVIDGIAKDFGISRSTLEKLKKPSMAPWARR